MSSPKTATATLEQIQIRERERRERRRDQARRRRQKQASEETPEQRRQRLDKEWAQKKERQSKETPEERRKRLDKELAYKRKKQSEETPEQRQQRLDIELALKRKRCSQETPENRLKRLERDSEFKRIKEKERRERETPEERRQRLDRKVESKRRCFERRGCQYTPEELEKKPFDAMIRGMTRAEEQKEKRRKKSLFWYQANKERIRERQNKNYKQWVKSLTEEKKERHLESVRKALRKSSRKIYERIKQDPIKWQERQRYLRERHANATQEESLRRKRRLKMNAEKRKLKRKLEGKSVSVQEIELQLSELGERMWKEFYPDGDVPLPSKSRRPTRKVKEADAVSTTFAQSSCKKEEVQDIHQVDSTEDDPFMTFEHPIQGSNYDDVASPSPLPSPPSSPAVDIQDDEETVDPTKCITDLRLPCPHCDVTISTDQLRSHIFLCHNKNCWKCPKCKQVMLSPQELSQHYASAHKISPSQHSTKDVSSFTGNYLCLKCPPLKWFETRQDLFTHVEQQHSSNFWPCLDCHVLKYSEHAFRLHRTVCHSAPGRVDNAR